MAGSRPDVLHSSDILEWGGGGGGGGILSPYILTPWFLHQCSVCAYMYFSVLNLWYLGLLKGTIIYPRLSFMGGKPIPSVSILTDQRRLDIRHQMSPMCHVHQYKMYRNIWQVSIAYSCALRRIPLGKNSVSLDKPTFQPLLNK